MIRKPVNTFLTLMILAISCGPARTMDKIENALLSGQLDTALAMLDNIDTASIVEKGNEFGPMCSQTGANGKYRMARCTTCNGYGYYDMDRVAFCR